MNKNVILPFVALIMVLAMVGAASAATTVDTLEVRGTIEELDGDTPTLGEDRVWDYSEFAGFWYDLDDNLETETLTIFSGAVAGDTIGPLNYDDNQRTIGEGRLEYTTHPVFQEYEIHQDVTVDRDATKEEDDRLADGLLEQHIGLLVESSNPRGDCGYYIEGWMAEEYVAIDGNADELCKLLVEFEDDDKKTMATGEEWDLGGGFALVANQIDLEGDKVWFSLKKDGRELDNEVATTGGTDKQDCVYTYTADIGGEEDIPVFSCYVDAVFRGTDTNVVQIMYVFLIDDDVLEIDTSDTYGAMEVMTASSDRIVLKNDETTVDLDTDTTEHIMGDMYFKTADDDNAIRFYPMVEYTIRGDGVTPVEPEVTPTEPEEAPAVNVTEPEVNVTEPEVTPPAEGEEAPPAEGEEAPAEAEEAPTKKPGVPGFEAVFAIAGLLAVAYLVLRQRE